MQRDRRYRIAVAPMMDWTDRHCRAFHRTLTRDALLYTEMIVADAVIHGDRDRVLGFSPGERPLAAQLGGSEPRKLAQAAEIVAALGYDEVNLNVGCPSDRVRSGTFGACLMLSPALVGDCVASMKSVVDVPVTVKCRIGVDDQDPEAALDHLADTVFAAGADALWVHARKAWLSGLSPKQNREVPPLDYDRVYRLKDRYSDRFIGINGGVASIDAALAHLDFVDGVMIGRAAYQTPAILAQVDRRLLAGARPDPDLAAAVESFLPYIEAALGRGARLSSITRHMLGLFHGHAGARRWRQILSVEAARPGAGVDVVTAALAEIRAAAKPVPPELVPA